MPSIAPRVNSSNPSIEMETQQCCGSEANSIKPTNHMLLTKNDSQSNAYESNAINLINMRDEEFKPSKISSNLPDYVTLNNNATPNTTSLVNRFSALKPLLIIASLVVLIFVITLFHFHRKKGHNNEQDASYVIEGDEEADDIIVENIESVDVIPSPNELSRYNSEDMINKV